MDDLEVLSYSLVFLTLWLVYGFKWAILVIFTVILVVYTLRNYSKWINEETSVKYNHIKSDNTSVADELDETHEMYTRRYVNPVLTKRDLAFTDLQMNRSLSPRRGNSLKSPQPLISQMNVINRHLSFNNMSYYPERTMGTTRQQKQNVILNNTTLNNSYLLSPISNLNTSRGDISPSRKLYNCNMIPSPSRGDASLSRQPYNMISSPSRGDSSLSQSRQPYNMISSPSRGDSSPSRQPCYNSMVSSPSQERYSPRCFSVLDPSVNNMMVDSPSMVKISQPSEGIAESPSFESILQKRLQKTKENPCSRHSVLSALTQKSNRKRTAFEADGSFQESTYSVKKRRRDDLDDFLDSVSDPLNPPPTSSSYNVKSLKRPSLHSNVGEIHGSGLERNKKYIVTAYKYENSPSTEKDLVNDNNVDEENRITNKINQDDILQQDNGVVLEDTGKKSKKRKSVTFSKETKAHDPSPRHNKVTHTPRINPVRSNRVSHSSGSEAVRITSHEKESLGSEVVETTEDKLQSTDKETSECTKPERKARFFSEASLRSGSRIVKIKKKVPLRPLLTWEDFQESRREAWRRSEKLLDDIEGDIANETGAPAGSIVGSINSGVTMTTNVITSANIGSSNPQGLPITSLSATTSSTSTKTTFPTHNIIPSSQNIVPTIPTTVPSTNNILPSSQNIPPPAAQNVVPSGHNVVPSGQNITLPSIQKILPSTQNISLPSSQNVVPQVHTLSNQSTLLSTTNIPAPIQNTPPSSQTISGGLVNFVGNVSKSVQHPTTTTTSSATKSFGNNLALLNPATNTSNFTFGNNQNTTTNANPILSSAVANSFGFGTSGVSVNPVNKLGTATDFKFAVPNSHVKSQSSTSTSVGTPSTTLPFTGFGSTLGSSTSVTQSTNIPSFAFKSTASSNLTPSTQQNVGIFGQAAGITSSLPQTKPSFNVSTALPQTSSSSTTFNFQTSGIATTLPQTTTSSSAFSFQSPSAQAPTTSSIAPFSFQAPAGQSQPVSQPASLPATQAMPSGLFNFNAASTVGGFGLTAPQSSAGFSFTSQNAPGFGSVNSAGVPHKSGGFSFAAQTITKPTGTAGGGFNFGQATPGTFNFGSSPAPGGFAFGSSIAGPGAPFASSTPMPGSAGGMPGGVFALGSSGTTGSVVAKARTRRRVKK